MTRVAAILSAVLVHLFLSTTAVAETSFLVPSTEVSALVLGAQSGVVPPLRYREQVDNARAQMVLNNIHREGSTLNLRNRRNAYLDRLGDVYRTAELVEEIGEAGARVYARSVGYEPIYVGQPGSGRGFDQVYRNGNQIVVIEAKGGGSPLKKYHGFLQGTPEYTEIVAQQTLRIPDQACH
jgi:hypothetical protein